MAAAAPAQSAAGAALSAMTSAGPGSAAGSVGTVGRGEGPGSLLLRALALAAALAAAAAQEAAPPTTVRPEARALPLPAAGLRAAPLPPQEAKGPPTSLATSQEKSDRAALAAQQLVAARAFLNPSEDTSSGRGTSNVAETIAARAAELAAATAAAAARAAVGSASRTDAAAFRILEVNSSPLTTKPPIIAMRSMEVPEQEETHNTGSSDRSTDSSKDTSPGLDNTTSHFSGTKSSKETSLADIGSKEVAQRRSNLKQTSTYPSNGAEVYKKQNGRTSDTLKGSPVTVRALSDENIKSTSIGSQSKSMEYVSTPPNPQMRSTSGNGTVKYNSTTQNPQMRSLSENRTMENISFVQNPQMRSASGNRTMDYVSSAMNPHRNNSTGNRTMEYISSTHIPQVRSLFGEGTMDYVSSTQNPHMRSASKNRTMEYISTTQNPQVRSLSGNITIENISFVQNPQMRSASGNRTMENISSAQNPEIRSSSGNRTMEYVSGAHRANNDTTTKRPKGKRSSKEVNMSKETVIAARTADFDKEKTNLNVDSSSSSAQKAQYVEASVVEKNRSDETRSSKNEPGTSQSQKRSSKEASVTERSSSGESLKGSRSVEKGIKISPTSDKSHDTRRNVEAPSRTGDSKKSDVDTKRLSSTEPIVYLEENTSKKGNQESENNKTASKEKTQNVKYHKVPKTGQEKNSTEEVKSRALDEIIPEQNPQEVVSMRSFDTDTMVSPRILDETREGNGPTERASDYTIETPAQAPASVEYVSTVNADESIDPTVRMYSDYRDTATNADGERAVTHNTDDIAARSWDDTTYVVTHPGTGSLLEERSWRDMGPHEGPTSGTVGARSYNSDTETDRPWEGHTSLYPPTGSRSWDGPTMPDVPVGMGARFMGYEQYPPSGVTPWGMHSMSPSGYGSAMGGRMIDYPSPDLNPKTWNPQEEIKTKSTVERSMNDTVSRSIDTTEKTDQSSAGTLNNRELENEPKPTQATPFIGQRLLNDEKEPGGSTKSNQENGETTPRNENVPKLRLDDNMPQHNETSRALYNSKDTSNDPESTNDRTTLDSIDKSSTLSERTLLEDQNSNAKQTVPVEERSFDENKNKGLVTGVPSASENTYNEEKISVRALEDKHSTKRYLGTTESTYINPEEVAGRLLDDIARAAAEAVRSLEKSQDKRLNENTSEVVTRLLDTVTASGTEKESSSLTGGDVINRSGQEETVLDRAPEAQVTEQSPIIKRYFGETARDLRAGVSTSSSQTTVSSLDESKFSSKGVDTIERIAAEERALEVKPKELHTESNSEPFSPVNTESPARYLSRYDSTTAAAHTVTSILGKDTERPLSVRSNVENSGSLLVSGTDHINTSPSSLYTDGKVDATELYNRALNSDKNAEEKYVTQVEPTYPVYESNPLVYATEMAPRSMIPSFAPNPTQFFYGVGRALPPDPTFQTISSSTQTSRRGYVSEPRRRGSVVNVDVIVGKNRNCIPGARSGQICSRRGIPNERNNRKHHHHHHHHHRRGGARYSSRAGTLPDIVDPGPSYLSIRRSVPVPSARAAVEENDGVAPTGFGAPRGLNGGEMGGSAVGAEGIGSVGDSGVGGDNMYTGRLERFDGGDLTMRVNAYPSYDYGGYGGRSAGLGNFNSQYNQGGTGAAVMFSNPYAEFYIR